MESIDISTPLNDARVYEEHMKAFVSEEERQSFHLTPLVGWMNDPNGFSFHDGRYHLFYQYNPYKATWAAMHWATRRAKTCSRGSTCRWHLPPMPRMTTTRAASREAP